MEMEIYPGIKEIPKVRVLEQRPDYIKSRVEYSNGFIFINEVSAGGVKIDPNFNLKQRLDGKLEPDFNSPNSKFTDIK